MVKTEALPDTTAPSEVMDVKVGNVTETSALISWTNPVEEDFAQVNLYFNGEKIKTVLKDGTPSHALTGLAPDTAYSVLIMTVDQLGNESTGKTVAFNTVASTIEDSVELPATGNTGEQEPPVSPDPSDPDEQEQPISQTPAPHTPAPSPVEEAPVPDNGGELLITKEKLIETDGKIELTLSSNAGKFIFSPDVWNELKIMSKDLYISLNGLSILMPKENVADLTLEHITEVEVSLETSAPPKGANLLTDLVKIEMVDQVSKERLNTFDKPVTITLKLPAAPSAGMVKATFGAKKLKVSGSLQTVKLSMTN